MSSREIQSTISLPLTLSEMAVTWQTFRKWLSSNQQNETPSSSLFWHEGCNPFWPCLHSHLLISRQLWTSDVWLFKAVFSRFVSLSLISFFPLFLPLSFSSTSSQLYSLLTLLLSIIIERNFATNMPTWDKRSSYPKHCLLPYWLVFSIFFSRRVYRTVLLIQWDCFSLVNRCIHRSHCLLQEFSVMWLWRSGWTLSLRPLEIFIPHCETEILRPPSQYTCDTGTLNMYWIEVSSWAVKLN